MNRLLIIGNGFDLAHGLKTSYKDFIEYILEYEKNILIQKSENIDISNNFHYEDDFILIDSTSSLISMIKNIHSFKGITFFDKIDKIYLPKPDCNNYIDFEVQYKNEFLRELLINSDLKNWIDIEYEYYKALVDCINRERRYDIDELNKYFNIIKKALENYISIQMKNNINPIDEIKRKIQSIINPYKNAMLSEEKDYYPTLIINFNYTNLIDTYMSKLFPGYDNNENCVNIHGQINDPKNKIIFGFGDEYDDNYKLIEKLNDNRYLDNVKSINYSLTKNYKNILKFIEDDEYQVFIMGHSCGISDKTLLQTLFEHKNCKSIEIYYHKIDESSDNYLDISKNISRIFTDKYKLRKIVVNKEDSSPLLKYNN